MSRLSLSLALLLAVASSACCRRGDDSSSSSTKGSSPSLLPAVGAPSFAYDPNLPPACKANVSFLVNCASTKGAAERADLTERARVMQKAQMEDVAKSGATKANATCASLSSIVRMNKACGG